MDLKKPIELTTADFEDVPVVTDENIEQTPLTAPPATYETRARAYGDIAMPPSLSDQVTAGVKNFIGGKILSPFTQGSTMGLINPNLPGKTQESLAGGYAQNPGQVAGKAIETASELAGNLVGGKVIAKSAGVILNPIRELVKKIPANLITSEGSKFANKIQDIFWKVKGTMGKTFENGLNLIEKANPGKTVDATATIQSILDEATLDPGVNQIVARIPKLKMLVQNPELASKLTLEDARNIKTAIMQKISPAKYAGKTPLNMNERAVLDVADNLNSDIMSAFPELKPVNAEYAKSITNYNDLRRTINSNNMFNNIEKNWHNPQMQAKMREVFDPQTLAEMKGYLNARSTIKWAKRGVLGYAGVKATGAAWRGVTK